MHTNWPGTFVTIPATVIHLLNVPSWKGQGIEKNIKLNDPERQKLEKVRNSTGGWTT